MAGERIQVNDQVGQAALVLDELAWELTLLCRGLANTQVRCLEAVSTVIRLSRDPRQETMLRLLCGRLAEEAGLDWQVEPAIDGWRVAFSLPQPPTPAVSRTAARQPRENVLAAGRARVAAGRAWLGERPSPFPSPC